MQEISHLCKLNSYILYYKIFITDAFNFNDAIKPNDLCFINMIHQLIIFHIVTILVA